MASRHGGHAGRRGAISVGQSGASPSSGSLGGVGFSVFLFFYSYFPFVRRSERVTCVCLRGAELVYVRVVMFLRHRKGCIPKSLALSRNALVNS